MNSAILFIAALIILAILFIVFRIQVLVDVLMKKKDSKADSANSFNAAMWLVFGVAFTAFVIYTADIWSNDFLPEAASIHGVQTDNMFWLSMIIIGIAFAIVSALIFVFPYLYQYKSNKRAYFYPHNNKLELVWTVIPAIVLAALVFNGWKVWTDITGDYQIDGEPVAEEEVVHLQIMGKQFNWMIKYPGEDNKLGRYDFRKVDATNQMGMDFTDKASLDDFIPREIHIPKGKVVQFNIRARDVLHSVFAPHFRVKMDAVPGMPTQFWFVPTKTTAEMRAETDNPDFNYEIACTEICGRGHFGMRMVVVVDEPAEYEEWLKTQKPWAESNPDYIATLDIDEELKALALNN